MAGVMPLARQLGDLLDAGPIPPVEPIEGHQFRPSRRDLWPPEVWAEMQAIYNDATLPAAMQGRHSPGLEPATTDPVGMAQGQEDDRHDR